MMDLIFKPLEKDESNPIWQYIIERIAKVEIENSVCFELYDCTILDGGSYLVAFQKE